MQGGGLRYGSQPLACAKAMVRLLKLLNSETLILENEDIHIACYLPVRYR